MWMSFVPSSPATRSVRRCGTTMSSTSPGSRRALRSDFDSASTATNASTRCRRRWSNSRATRSTTAARCRRTPPKFAWSRTPRRRCRGWPTRAGPCCRRPIGGHHLPAYKVVLVGPAAFRSLFPEVVYASSVEEAVAAVTRAAPGRLNESDRPAVGGRPPGGQIDIFCRTPSASMSAPRPRATISPRSITRYWSASSAAKS